jgi:HEAT repeat protein
MNTRLIRTASVLLTAVALGVIGCAEARTAETVSQGPVAQPTQLEKQYVETIDRLLPGMGAEKIVDRKDAQMEFERICFTASAPDTQAERVALCMAIMTRVGPEIAKPARVWLLRKVEPIGRDEVVPGLTKLFSDQDPQIRELARRALENNPSPKAAAALRDELAKAQTDEWRVALINALAFRNDAESVGAFTKLASDSNACVAKAAVAALGDIATDSAVRTLNRLMNSAQPALRDTVVYASLRAADALAARGSRDQAAKIYEQLDASSEPERIRIAAVEGLARAQGVKVLPRLVKLVNGTDVHMQLIAAQCMRDISDPKATAGLTAALNGVSPTAAAILLDVLGQRGDAAAMPAVTRKVTDVDQAVRVAALVALGRIGDSSVVPLLAERATKSDGDERAAATDALVHLRGQGVDNTIVAAIGVAEPSGRSILVRAAADRRSSALLPTLYANVDDPDEAARVAVVKALGRLAPTADLPKVVNALVKARGDAVHTAAEEAVCLVASRIEDQSLRVAPVIAALSNAPTRTQVSLIHVLGQLQGDAALAALRTVSRSQDKAVRDAVVEAMSKWPGQHCLTWLFSGPYKSEGRKATDLFDMAFDPEDPDAKATWKPLDIEGNKQSGEIVLSKRYKDSECCGYAKTDAWSDKEQQVRLVVGSDDGIKVWLNGKVVHANNATRGFKCDEDAVTVTLKQGWNPLLIKITQGGGDWSFCCGIKAADGGPIEGLKFNTEVGR